MTVFGKSKRLTACGTYILQQHRDNSLSLSTETAAADATVKEYIRTMCDHILTSRRFLSLGIGAMGRWRNNFRRKFACPVCGRCQVQPPKCDHAVVFSWRSVVVEESLDSNYDSVSSRVLHFHFVHTQIWRATVSLGSFPEDQPSKRSTARVDGCEAASIIMILDLPSCAS